MARIVCEYCGTEYDDNMPRCPLCGTVNEAVADEEDAEEEVRPVRKRARGGARVAKSEDRIPKWIIALICVVLGIAVVIGALYAMYAMGVFTPDKDKEEDASLNLPVTPEENNQQGTSPAENDPASGNTAAPSGEVECVSIVVSPDAPIHLSDVGMSQTVTVTVLPSECTQPLVWTSSDESICVVDGSGVITAVDGGSATVTVSCGQIQRAVEVICDFQNSLENNAALNHTDISLFSVGEQTQLVVNNPPRDPEITWTSSDSAICTVDEDGLVVAKADGTATVTANVNGRELECVVRCNIPGHAPATPGNAEGPGSGNQLDHSDVSLNVGENFEISVVNGVSGGWNVTDGSIITVDGNGIVTALAKGQAEVYTIIGGQRLSCIVRVR